LKLFALLLLMTGPISEAHAPPPQPIAIEILPSSSQTCAFKIDGNTLSSAALKKMLKAEPDKTRQVHISAVKDAPWHCVAGAVSEAQRAGFETAGFISIPDSE
jgi:biopolymer transport protein ExbD